MKFLLTLLCACSALVSFAQDQTRYYDARHRLDPLTSRYRATITPSGRGFLVKEMTLDNKSVMTGSYAALPDDLGKSRNGDFIYYYSNGNKKMEGAYRDNLRTGMWKFYDYEDGMVHKEEQYAGDSLDGPARYYSSRTKKVTREGNHVNGKEEGLWKEYNSDGSMSGEVTYVKGKKEGVSIAYMERGFVEKTTYKAGEALESHLFDGNGSEITKKKDKKKINSSGAIYTYVEQMPAPGYNYNDFLSENIVYPDSARRHNVEGRVIVKFVVDEEGKVNDLTIVKSVSPEIDEEAMRVVSLFPQWKPGMQNGRRVSVYFTLPIQFKLTN